MIYHFKSLVLVRKGRAFYTTLYQEVFFGNPGGGGSLMDPKLRLTNVLNIPIKVETISDMVNPEENWGVLEFMI